MHLLIQLAALALTVFALSMALKTVHVRSFGSAVVVSVVFSLLNWLLGWLIKALLVVPGILTLGLLFLILPFVVNLILLWITDKLLHAFRIDGFKSYALVALAITAVNWLMTVPRGGY